MKKNQTKVLHGLANYGIQSGFFVRELRKNGVEAVSVAMYDRFEKA